MVRSQIGKRGRTRTRRTVLDSWVWLGATEGLGAGWEDRGQRFVQLQMKLFAVQHLSLSTPCTQHKNSGGGGGGDYRCTHSLPHGRSPPCAEHDADRISRRE